MVSALAVTSMTGFGSATFSLGERRYEVVARSVNHKALDIRVTLPHELLAFEPALVRLVRDRARRGHIDLRVRALDGASAAPLAIDMSRLSMWVELYRAAHAVLTSGESFVEPLPSKEWVLGQPGVVVARETIDEPDAEARLVAAVGVAMDALVAMRRWEGVTLGEALAECVARIADWTEQVAAHAGVVPAALRQRIERRISEAKRELGAGWNDDRLELEVVLAIERADVTEELDRLRAHVAAVQESHGSTGEVGEPQGKRLAFLAQEMGREANTVAAKSASVQLSQAAVELRVEIERLKEQLANVE